MRSHQASASATSSGDGSPTSSISSASGRAPAQRVAVAPRIGEPAHGAGHALSLVWHRLPGHRDELFAEAVDLLISRGSRLPRSPIGQQSDPLVDQGPQLVVQPVVAVVVEVGPVSPLQRGLDHRPRVGQAERPHDRVGLSCERALDRLDRGAVHEVARICALRTVDAHTKTTHLAVGALEVDPHRPLVTPVVGQQRRPVRRHITERTDPARERRAVLRQPRQQPCGPAPISGRAVGADRRGHHRSGAAVRAGLRRSQRARRGQHRGTSKTNGTEQDLRGCRPYLNLIKVGALGRDTGGVVQKHLLQRRLFRRRSRRPPLMAAFSGPGALRSHASAPAAAMWTWHRDSLPSLGSGPASADDREPAGRLFLADHHRRRFLVAAGGCGDGFIRFGGENARYLGIYRRVRQHMMSRPPRAAPADP